MRDENAILEYWRAINAGEVNVGKWIKLLYEVILEGLTEKRWFFSAQKANNAVAFIERFCHHFKGKLAPGRIKLELWQRASISLIFGVVDAQGRRQFREVAWYIGRKMGKSLVAAGCMEYIAFAAGEFGSEIYFLATKVDQADLSFSAFEFNYKHEPVLGKRIRSTKRGLVIDESNTLIKRLPFSDKTLDGLNPMAFLGDEASSWPAKKGLRVWEVMMSGTGAREEPLGMAISSGGYIPEGIYDELFARGTAFLNGNSREQHILQIGKQLGKKKKQLEPYARHAMNYRNLFNPKYNLMQGRQENGEFYEPFSPFKWGGEFTEGNSWHYTWSVFHDPAGLIALMGGTDTFTQMLDSVFIVPPIFDDSYYGGIIHEIREMQVAGMGNYAHGNQPIQHMIYLYDYASQPWKTQYWVRETMDRLYSSAPDGYCGDEDNGQTSAWYVFSALGFYPVCPGSGEYILGTPYFRKATVHFENGRTLTFTAEQNSHENRYIDRMTVNGQDYTRNYLRRADLQQGGEVVYRMSPVPNRQRGTSQSDLPYSFSTSKK